MGKAAGLGAGIGPLEDGAWAGAASRGGPQLGLPGGRGWARMTLRRRSQA